MRISLVLLITFLASCSEEKNQIPTDNITGTWGLTHYYQGFASPEYYQSGDIIWEFSYSNKLVVTINVDLSKSKIPIVTNGKYAYELNDKKIEVKNIKYDFAISDNILTLSDHPEVDGPQIKFIRIQ